MSFQWEKDGEGIIVGRGTIAEFFSYEPHTPLMEYSAELSEEQRRSTKRLMEHYQERDRNLCRLLLEFAVMSGMKPDDMILADEKLNKEWKPEWNQGWVVLITSPDDAIYSIWKDGQPMGAYYASFRGCYQAGCYIHSTQKMYFAHNAFNPEMYGEQDKWHETKTGACAEIARDSLLEWAKRNKKRAKKAV